MGPSPGDTFGRYVIEALLGEGGMGRVYRAHDTRLERQVALKLLLPAKPDDAGDTPSSGPRSGGAARLVREARAAAALDHPNAVAVFDVGEEGGIAFIAMELVEGRSLRAYVGDADVPLSRKIKWLVEVARALGAAHDRGLVHRDVKPENVIVRAKDGVAKVLDFGIARRVKLVTSDDEGATMTSPGRLVGTPVYMSPEALRGEPVDGRADDFSWGVVAYELLTGAPPWSPSGGSVQLLSDILSKEIAPFASAKIPAAVDAVVRKALAKSPRDRFDAMDDVIAGLEAYATGDREGPPIASTEPPPDVVQRTSEPAMRTVSEWRGAASRTRVLAAAALAIGIGAGAMALLPRARGDGDRPTAAPPASASSPSAVPITSTWAPAASTPEADRLYRAGLQELRDASIQAGVQRFVEALSYDPYFAPARLRLALLFVWQGDTARAREHYRAASQQRATLGDRDGALLEAIAPIVTGEPADPRAAAARLSELAARFANDAEIAFYAGRQKQLVGDTAGAQAELDRALSLDPGFAIVHWARAIAAEDAADFDAALRAYDACLSVSSGAASCLRSRGAIYAQRGQCAELERDARRMLAVEPTGFRAYDYLARALAARDRSLEAVREALAHKWALVPESEREARAHADSARLAMMRGDFAEAEREANALEQRVSAASSELAHAEPALLLVDAALEQGDVRRAAQIAARFRSRRVAWIGARAVGDGPVGALPSMLAVERRAGTLTVAAFESARDEWLRDAQASMSPLWVRELWVPAFAAPADTPEEANAALAALPRYSPLPPSRDLSLGDAAVGHVYVLAGRDADARPFLERATASCLALDDPFAHTRAFLDLGRAREASDRPGACAAYATVIARWGAAKPRSVSADQASRRMRALGCPRP